MNNRFMEDLCKYAKEHHIPIYKLVKEININQNHFYALMRPEKAHIYLDIDRNDTFMSKRIVEYAFKNNIVSKDNLEKYVDDINYLFLYVYANNPDRFDLVRPNIVYKMRNEFCPFGKISLDYRLLKSVEEFQKETSFNISSIKAMERGLTPFSKNYLKILVNNGYKDQLIELASQMDQKSKKNLTYALNYKERPFEAVLKKCLDEHGYEELKKYVNRKKDLHKMIDRVAVQDEFISKGIIKFMIDMGYGDELERIYREEKDSLDLATLDNYEVVKGYVKEDTEYRKGWYRNKSFNQYQILKNYVDNNDDFLALIINFQLENQITKTRMAHMIGIEVGTYVKVVENKARISPKFVKFAYLNNLIKDKDLYKNESIYSEIEKCFNNPSEYLKNYKGSKLTINPDNELKKLARNLRKNDRPEVFYEKYGFSLSSFINMEEGKIPFSKKSLRLIIANSSKEEIEKVIANHQDLDDITYKNLLMVTRKCYQEEIAKFLDGNPKAKKYVKESLPNSYKNIFEVKEKLLCSQRLFKTLINYGMSIKTLEEIEVDENSNCNTAKSKYNLEKVIKEYKNI